MVSEYYGVITTVILISAVMVVSPGQDFAMITRNSLVYSRKSGLIGAFGIFTAIWLHVSYSLAGIALLISQSDFLFNSIKYLGAGYLLYLGIKSLFTKPSVSVNNDFKKTLLISNAESFKSGFISNALNPKTTLFFLSIFTQVVTPETPYSIQFIFGLIIATAHLIWFSIVAYFFSSKALQSKIEKSKVWIEKIMGGCLCLLALRIAILD